MRTSLVMVLGVLLAGCGVATTVGEQTAAVGDSGGVKGFYFSTAKSAGAFESLDFPGDGTFTGTLGGGNTVAGSVKVNPPGHVTLHFAGIGGSACARLNAASVVVQGWLSSTQLSLSDACSDGTSYTLSETNPNR